MARRDAGKVEREMRVDAPRGVWVYVIREMMVGRDR
jgi:hypothetical protein